MEVNKSDFRDISVLIAGCGSIGKRHVRILAALGVKNICACDPVKEQLDKLINETPIVSACNSFEDGLNQKPDFVFILSPTKLHIPMAMEAINAVMKDYRWRSAHEAFSN
jgi:predicted dehydrogenase